jgi:hypothetical protein
MDYSNATHTSSLRMLTENFRMAVRALSIFFLQRRLSTWRTRGGVPLVQWRALEGSAIRRLGISVPECLLIFLQTL